MGKKLYIGNLSYDVDGCALTVNEAKPKENRRGGSSGGRGRGFGGGSHGGFGSR